ncbi:MAG: hypothetical protein LKE30_02515 [Bacteroidales bacterium]|jgi:hypothetical protein|nr:hypothetical protein [Bacteroidales bacterium]
MSFEEKQVIIIIITFIAIYLIFKIISFIKEMRKPRSIYSYVWKTWTEGTKISNIVNCISPDLDYKGWDNDDDLSYWLRLEDFYKGYIPLIYIDNVKLNQDSYRLLPDEEKIKIINRFIGNNHSKLAFDTFFDVYFDTQYDKEQAIKRAKDLKTFIKNNSSNIKGYW